MSEQIASTTEVKKLVPVKNEKIGNFKATVNNPEFKFTPKQKVNFFHKAFPSAFLAHKNHWMDPVNHISMIIDGQSVVFK
jgi:hypothetical protein